MIGFLNFFGGANGKDKRLNLFRVSLITLEKGNKYPSSFFEVVNAENFMSALDKGVKQNYFKANEEITSFKVTILSRGDKSQWW